MLKKLVREGLDGRSCFDSADMGDVELIGKVERGRGLQTQSKK
jgi:hypothetical protein